jgi:hypothetical protein
VDNNFLCGQRSQPGLQLCPHARDLGMMAFLWV